MPQSLPPVRHPARFVPLSALATGAPGQPAVPTGPDNPLPTREQPLRGARAVLPDTPVVPGTALLVDCSAGGRATFVMQDGSNLVLTLSAGLTLLPLAVVELISSDLTAVLDAWVLD